MEIPGCCDSQACSSSPLPNRRWGRQTGRSAPPDQLFEFVGRGRHVGDANWLPLLERPFRPVQSFELNGTTPEFHAEIRSAAAHSGPLLPPNARGRARLCSMPGSRPRPGRKMRNSNRAVRPVEVRVCSCKCDRTATKRNPFITVWKYNRRAGDAFRGPVTLLLSGLGEARAYLGQRAGALRNQRLGKRQRGIAHFALYRRVGVERLVAGGVGLPVADVAVEFGLRSRRRQLHEAQPVGDRAPDVLGSLDVAMHHHREQAAGEMARIVPAASSTAFAFAASLPR